MPCIVAEHLEEALALWELGALETELAARGTLATAGTDPFREIPSEVTAWRNLRRTLLDNGVATLGPKAFTLDSIIEIPHGDVIERHPALTQLQTFPIELFNWTRKSRRVFRLNPWLQQVLEYADFPSMHWGDVLWPFDAFAIELAVPIAFYSADLERNIQYDSILLSQVPLDNTGRNVYVVMRLLSSSDLRSINSAGRTKEEQREVLTLLAQKRQWNRLARVVERGRRRVRVKANFPSGQGIAVFPIFKPGVEENKPIQLNGPVLYEYGRQWYDQKANQKYAPVYMEEIISRLAKIAVGLCLYLESISSEGQENLVWERNRAKGGPLGAVGVITDEAYVCKVVNRGLIDPTTTKQDKKHSVSGGFKRPHWRRAHRRRPPHSPKTAPKSVKVPPRLINLHLVPLYGIVGGTQTEIKSEE